MKTQGAGTKRWRKAEKRNRHTAALFTRLYLKGKAGTISIHLKTMLPLLSITTLLLFQPCFALEVGFVREFRTWMTRPAGSKCWSRIRSGACGNRDWRWFRSTSEPKRLQCNDCSSVLKSVFFQDPPCLQKTLQTVQSTTRIMRARTTQAKELTLRRPCVSIRYWQAAHPQTPSPVLSCKNWDFSQGKMVY